MKTRALVTAAVAVGIVMTGALLAFLSPGLMVVIWSVPTGLALGGLLGPRRGGWLRAWSLLVAVIGVERLYRLAPEASGPAGPYWLAVATVVLALSGVVGFRHLRFPPRTAQSQRPADD